YVAALNHLYLATPALFQQDGGWEGFSWIDPDNGDQSVLSYRRRDKHGKEIVVLINFTPVLREHFRVGVPFGGVWQEMFNSDARCFGGDDILNKGDLRSAKRPMHGLPQSVVLTLPPLGAVILRCRRKFPEKRRKYSEK
ncbi:MAG: alpha amylase C-terminal domain-containing protein, partial [Clostridia bacterium]|nr:alpha amylase C-terminal domain-containing protein [Clostridia bacterium]